MRADNKWSTDRQSPSTQIFEQNEIKKVEMRHLKYFAMYWVDIVIIYFLKHYSTICDTRIIRLVFLRNTFRYQVQIGTMVFEYSMLLSPYYFV